MGVAVGGRGVLVGTGELVGVLVGLGVLEGVGLGVEVDVGLGVDVGDVDCGTDGTAAAIGNRRGLSQTVTTDTQPPETCLHPPQVELAEHFCKSLELKFKIKFGRWQNIWSPPGTRPLIYPRRQKTQSIGMN